ncbi:unnamed protein product, partial [Didymodactylos carnosus]
YPVDNVSDRDLFGKFIQDQLGITIHPSNIDSVWRFKTGSVVNNNRAPILGVSLNDFSLRSSILFNASKLMNSSDNNVKSVYISKHLTLIQSQIAYERRLQQRNRSQTQDQQQESLLPTSKTPSTPSSIPKAVSYRSYSNPPIIRRSIRLSGNKQTIININHQQSSGNQQSSGVPIE